MRSSARADGRAAPRRLLGRLWRRVVHALSAEARALRAVQDSGDPALLQPYPTTFTDRHPPLFRALARELAGIARPRILSFGCSTGQEVVAIARHLPNARIDAVDINPHSIAVARRRVTRARLRDVRFVCAGAPPVADGAGYDAVLCLSVLRHGRLESQQPDDCGAILPFARVAATLDALDRVLRPGGLLMLWGCHFRLRDTALAGRYAVIPVAGKQPQPGPFYGPDDRRLDAPPSADFLFRKAD